MIKSVLLDTCFLISFVDKLRPNHENAIGFYKYFIENKISMYLSSIVVSEFSIKQSIEDLPLEDFRSLSYNIPDSYASVSIYNEMMNDKPEGACRNCIKDDYKLTGLCEFNKIDYLITEDRRFFDKLNQFKKKGAISFTPLFLPTGFEVSFNVQTKIFDEMKNIAVK